MRRPRDHATTRGLSGWSRLLLVIIQVAALVAASLGSAVAQDASGDPAPASAAVDAAPATEQPAPRPEPDPTPRPTPERTAEPEPDPTPRPTREPEPDPTPRPEPDPTPAPASAAPTAEPTPEPTAGPTPAATDVSPAPTPVASPTPGPTSTEGPTPTAPGASPEPTLEPVTSPEPSLPPEPSAGTSPMPSASPAPTEAPAETQGLIIRFRVGVSAAEQRDVVALAGGTQTDVFAALRMRVVMVAPELQADIEHAYRADLRVESVEVDHVRDAGGTPSDPAWDAQWNLRQIHWGKARNAVTPSGTATIAVLDTGVDGSHPDLAGRIAGSWSAFDTDALVDPNGHGTAVAGIAAAATNNDTGIAGVAYANVHILAVQVLDASGSGNDSDIIGGVLWAADHGADVILMAFSNPGYSPALQAAIDYAWSRSIVLVAATGNDGSFTPTYPAGDHHVMGVSGTDENDQLAAGSNAGTDTFIAAPGVSIPATAVGGGWTTIGGTSAAAAQIAGAAALLRAIDPSASNGVIVGRLAYTAEPAGTASQTGNGRLDLLRAVTDDSNGSIDPTGAAGGGPFVGPYIAASTKYWVGCANTDWATNGNWSTSSSATCNGNVPNTGATTAAGSLDSATITTGRANYPSITGAIAIGSVTVHSGGAITLAGGTLTMTGTLNITGTFTIASGSAVMSSTSTSTVQSGGVLAQTGGTIRTSGSLTVNGTIDQSAGTLHMNVASATKPSASITLGSAGAINQSGTGTIDTYRYTTATGSTYIQAGGLFRLYNNFTNPGTFNATGGTFEFAGTGSSSTGFIATGTNQFFNVLVDAGVTARFTSSNGNNLVVLVRGDWTVNGTASLTSRATRVTFNGSGTQTIGGTVSTTFRDVVVNKASGTLVLARNATIGTTSSSTGSLALTQGNIVTGTSTLILASGGNTVTRGTGLVEGNLQKQVAGGTQSRTFEVGTGATYAPVTVSFTNVTTSGNLTVSSTGAQHPQIATASIVASQDVARYWTLTSGGSLAFTSSGATAGVVFTYAPGDVTGGTPTTFAVQRYSSGWTTPTIGTRTATSAAVSGLTAFGSFAIGTLVTTAVNGDGTLTVAPTSITAGATGNALAFTFTAPATRDLAAGSAVTTTIPAGWTAPQTTSATTAGYVTSTSGTCVAGAPAVTGTGPWLITVTLASGCLHGTTFTVTYGADSATRVTAPAAAGGATFQGQSRAGSAGTLTNLASAATLTVAAGAAVKLQVLLPGETAAPGTSGATPGKTGTPAGVAAGATVDATVNAVDANWNVVATATSTVAITSSDLNAGLPTVGPLTAGSRTFAITLRTVGSRTISATYVSGTPPLSSGISAAATVSPGAAAVLQVLLPGESAAPGTATGKTGSPTAATAGSVLTVTVNAVDANWNLITTATSTVAITSTDGNAVLPSNAALVLGTRTFSVTVKTAGSRTVAATDVTGSPTFGAGTSSATAVAAGTATKLQVLLPGETAAPGSATGKSGAPADQTAGSSVVVTVNAVDAYWNISSTATPFVTLSSTDANAALPARDALLAGTRTFAVTLVTAGTRTVTATYWSGTPTVSAGASASINVNAGTASKLQVLLPGETAAPGTLAGKTGSPATRTAGDNVTVTVKAVDSYWNVSAAATPTVAITTTDLAVSPPADAALVAGTLVVSMTFVTANTGTGWTVTAAYISGSPSVTSAISGGLRVNPGSVDHLDVVALGQVTAGFPFSLTVSAADLYHNRVTGYTGTVLLTTSDTSGTMPAAAALVLGTRTFSVTLRTAPTQTVTATDTGTGTITGTSSGLTVNAAAAQNISLALSPASITADFAMTSTATASVTDASGNGIAGKIVTITTTGDVTIGAVTDIGGGSYTATITASKTAGISIITATDTTDGGITAPATLTEVAGAAYQLQLLVPGETAVPGSMWGKTGSPTDQVAGVPFDVTLLAVDGNWNVATTASMQVSITTTGGFPVLPANGTLVSGALTFQVAFKASTGSGWAVRAAQVNDPKITGNVAVSSNVRVSAGSATKLQVLLPGETAAPGTTTGKSGSPTGVTAGSPMTITVRAVDANWNLVTSATPTVGITSSDGSATLPADAALVGGSKTFAVTLISAGSRTVGAAVVSGTAVSPGTSAAVAVAAGTAHHLHVTAAASTVAGASFALTVTALDAYENVSSGYAGTVHFTSSDPNATITLPANNTLASGTRTFTGAILKTTPAQTITATDTVTGSITGTTPTIGVTHSAPVSLTLTITPASIVADEVATSLATARVSDSYGNAVSGASVTIDTSGDETVGLVTDLGDGNYTATITASATAGTETITAVSGALSDTHTLVETAGPATRLQVLLPGEAAAPGTVTGKTGLPSGVTAGSLVAVTIRAVDANWNLVTSETPVVALGVTDPNGTQPDDRALAGGTSTFDVIMPTAGSWTATVTDLTPGAPLTSGTSAALTVSPGPGTRLQVLLTGEMSVPGSESGVTGTPTSVAAGDDVEVTVNVVDAHWNVDPTVSPTVALTSSDPAATKPATATLDNGTTSFMVTLKTAGPPRTVTATDQAVTDTLTPDTSSGITVFAGAATHLAVTAPTTTVSGSVFEVIVTALDDFGNIDIDYSGTLHFTSTDGDAVLPTDVSLPANEGTDVFSVTLKTTGTRTITATDLADSDITGTSGSIAVGSAAAFNISLTLTPRSITWLGPDNTSLASVTVTDRFGNGLSSKNVTIVTNGDVSISSVSYIGSGVYTATITASKTAGTEIITATDVTDGSVSATASLTETPGAAVKLRVLLPGETAAPGTTTGKTGTPTAQAAGAIVAATVSAVDVNWNTVPTAAPPVHLTSTDGNAVLPADGSLIAGVRTFNVTLRTAGARTVTAADTTAVSSLTAGTSAAVTVNAGTATRLQVLLPGETAAPGTATGKTGSPTDTTVGTAITVTVRAVDALWNVVASATPIVAITTTDGNAVPPSNAALVAGTKTFPLTFKTSDYLTVSATWASGTPALSAGTSALIHANPGTATQLQVLLPGETAAPGTATGKTGSPTATTAGTSISVVIRAVDANWNTVTTATHVVAVTSTDGNATLPANSTLIGGTRTVSVVLKTAGSRTITATRVSGSPAVTAGTSAAVTVNAGVAVKVQVLLPGETSAPGSSTGRTGSPTDIIAGTSLTATVNVVDAQWNVVASATPVVAITTSDANAVPPANAALVAGTRSFAIVLRTAEHQSVTATWVSGAPSVTAATSTQVHVNPGTATQLQVLLPGETAAPGTTTGKTPTSSPTPTTSVSPVDVRVQAVDAYWNIDPTASVVVAVSASAAATLPTDGDLFAGVRTFSVTLRAAGSHTVTATRTSGTSVSAGTSSAITVGPGTATMLRILLPGETAAPGTATGKTGTPTDDPADVPVTAVIDAVDANWNIDPTAALPILLTTTDPSGAHMSFELALTGGTTSMTGPFQMAGNWQGTASDVSPTGPLLAPGTSAIVHVIPGTPAKLHLVAPTSTIAGVALDLVVSAQDTYGNDTPAYVGTVQLTSTDPAATLPADAALIGGAKAFPVTLRTAGTGTITASASGMAPATSAPITVSAGVASRITLVLSPDTVPADPDLVGLVKPVATVTLTDATGNPVTGHAVTVGGGDDGTLISEVTDNLDGTYTAIITPGRLAHTVTITATDAGLTTSAILTETPGTVVRLRVLLPGETAVPGDLPTGTGKIGTPTEATAGSPVIVTVSAVDEYFNIVPGATTLVRITTSGGSPVLPPDASLASGSQTFPLALRTATATGWTITATDLATVGKLTAGTGTLLVHAGPVSKLQGLLPGESAAPGTPTGKTGTPDHQVAGAILYGTVNATDEYWNLVTGATPTVILSTTDPHGTTNRTTTELTLVLGTATLPGQFKSAGFWTVTAEWLSGSAPLSTATAGPVTVEPGAAVQLQVLLPGEHADPGSTTGKTAALPTDQAAGASVPVTVNAVDAYWNLVSSATPTLAFTSTDANATMQAGGTLTTGFDIVDMAFHTANASGWQFIATDLGGTLTTGTSATVRVVPGPVARLQALFPGEVAAPGTATGKTGTPTPQVVGIPLDGTVNAVDADWNLVTSATPTILLSSTDAYGTTDNGSPQVTLADGMITLPGIFRTAGFWTVTATWVSGSSQLLPYTSAPVDVAHGPVTGLQILLPGETAEPGSLTGKTGTPIPQVAGIPFGVTVNAVDQYWNIVSAAIPDVAITASDVNATLPVHDALADGTETFAVTLRTATSSGWTVTGTDLASSGPLAAGASSLVPVLAGAAARLQVLMSGEIAAPGTPTGKTGLPFDDVPTGADIGITINVVDDEWNVVPEVTPLTRLSSTCAYPVLPPDAVLEAGSWSTTVACRSAGYPTFTATDLSASGQLAPDTGTEVDVDPGDAVRLLVLMPGESPDPGSETGRRGTPTSQIAGATLQVAVEAVDAYWNLVASTTPTVRFTSSDRVALLPGPITLAGTGSASVTFQTPPSQTITATDEADDLFAGVSSAVTVIGPALTPPLTIDIGSGFPGQVVYSETQTVSWATAQAGRIVTAVLDGPMSDGLGHTMAAADASIESWTGSAWTAPLPLDSPQAVAVITGQAGSQEFRVRVRIPSAAAGAYTAQMSFQIVAP